MTRTRKRETVVLKTGKYTNDVHKMLKMTPKQKEKFIDEMELYANNFLTQHFGIQLEIPIEICGRLTSTGGSFHYLNKDLRISSKIKISERFMSLALLDEEGVDAILDILNHELVHYGLFATDSKEYSDGQGEFESMLEKLNIGASGATPKGKIKTKKTNVWYNIYDIYHEPLSNKKYKFGHTQKATNWYGQRVGFEIVKSYF